MHDQNWRAVRAFALFDLVVTGMLALPIVSGYALAILLSGFGFFGSPADWLHMPLLTMVFCNLAGVLGVLWNGLRFVHPNATIVRMDQWGRIAVAAVLIYYLTMQGAPVALWLFVVTELSGAWAEWRSLRRAGR